MIAQFDRDRLSPEEYLALERQSEVRHEYFDGEIVAMAGASSAHGILVTNWVALLRPQIRGTGCQLFSSDMKVKIPQRNRFYYPDLLLTCDVRDRETDYFKQYPTLIIEVLSEKTEAFDRGEKFRDYGELLSLEEYVLVSQRERLVERFARLEDGGWRLERYAGQATFLLRCLELRVDLALVYEDVEVLSI